MTAACLSTVANFVRRLAERNTQALTDRQLLDRFTRTQDEAAFAELVRRHGPAVLSVCRRVLHHEQDAEDAFQAAFLILVRKAGSIRQHESLGGWLFRVSYRLALRARAQVVRRREQLTAPDDLPLATCSEEPRDALGLPLDEELQRLPEAYRSAVVLCYLEGRSQAEAARLLATTANAVNSRLKRAREILRQRLARHGLLLSGGMVAAALDGHAAQAALPPALVRLTLQTAVGFTTNPVTVGEASAAAVALARGALQ